MSKHTPTPWEFELEPNGMTWSVWHDQDTLVAEVETEANARLIASAPELLDGLKSILESLRRGRPVETIHEARRIEMLIEKATGETP